MKMIIERLEIKASGSKFAWIDFDSVDEDTTTLTGFAEVDSAAGEWVDCLSFSRCLGAYFLLP